MEKEKSERIKEFSLAGFVLISVVLVLVIWSNTLSDHDPQGPGFYRATMEIDSNFYLTRTAEATSGTFQPTAGHKNERSTPTPTIAITMTETMTTTPIPPTPSVEFEQ
jgi:hypothetical protein